MFSGSVSKDNFKRIQDQLNLSLLVVVSNIKLLDLNTISLSWSWQHWNKDSWTFLSAVEDDLIYRKIYTFWAGFVGMLFIWHLGQD